MEQEKYAKLFNSKFKIGLVSWREAWCFEGEYPEQLFTEVHKGQLVFRQRKSSNRVSYQQLKRGLVRKKMIIKEPPLPF